MKALSRLCRQRFQLLVLIMATWITGSAAASEKELIVSAAAVLTNAFKAVAASYEKAHPEAKVILNFAASGALLQQIEQGAPADVFASADQVTMDQGQARGLIDPGTRRDFATNRMVLAVPGDSSLHLQGLADLSRDEVKRIAIVNPAFAPAGRYAREALVAAGLWSNVEPKFILASTVLQVVDYLGRGEVDAGFVFVTDVLAAGDKARGIAELTVQTPIRYPIAVVAATRQPALAGEFVAFVLSAEAQDLLARYGFGKP